MRYEYRSKHFCTACIVIVGLLLFWPADISAQENKQDATWIWYPGDYEIWLSNKMQARRTKREAGLPPLWQLYSPYPLVTFQKELELPEAEETVPAIYVDGTYLNSDSTWKTTHEDKQWIDENGIPHQSGTPWITAGTWNFNTPDDRPSEFRLPTEPWSAKKTEAVGAGHLVDFGKETFGYVKLHEVKRKGKIALYYGESRDEALDSLKCETLDHLKFDGAQSSDYTVQGSKAFRYVQVQPDTSVQYDSILMLYEYLPFEYRGQFNCSDDLLNTIWDVSGYTLPLNTREFFLDGIKRDCWIWSGVAHQCDIEVYISMKEIKVKGSQGQGKLIFEGKTEATTDSGAIAEMGDHTYELTLEPNKSYQINYKAVK